MPHNRNRCTHLKCFQDWHFILLTCIEESKNGLHPKHPLTARLVPTTHVLNATENISMKCRENPSSSKTVVQALHSSYFACAFLIWRRVWKQKIRKNGRNAWLEKPALSSKQMICLSLAYRWWYRRQAIISISLGAYWHECKLSLPKVTSWILSVM